MTAVTVDWRTADTMVAVVDSTGRVTSVGNGATAITAAAGGASGSATLTVDQGRAPRCIRPFMCTFCAIRLWFV